MCNMLLSMKWRLVLGRGKGFQLHVAFSRGPSLREMAPFSVEQARPVRPVNRLCWVQLQAGTHPMSRVLIMHQVSLANPKEVQQ